MGRGRWIAVAESAARYGESLPFGEYLKVGLAVTPLTLAFGI